MLRYVTTQDSTKAYSLRPTTFQDTEYACYYYLNATSRSFARVIQSLDDELKLPVCLFYLVLRGLDTVEDDMSLDLKRKVEVMKSFHEILYQPGWTFSENGKDEKDRDLLVHFDVVIDQFLKLPEKYQKVIVDITQRMSDGMQKFLEGHVVETMEDYNEYTHYVAGLVGLGLTDLFVASGLEPRLTSLPEERRLYLANSMGLFLQKVNITRDFIEDLPQGRRFWPMAIVGKYVWGEYPDSFDSLPNDPVKARAALNAMCADALTHVPESMEYLALLDTPSILAFCAIPQVMAIATFNVCFDNPKLFSMPLLKIRKGQAVEMIVGCNNLQGVKKLMLKYCREIGQTNLKSVAARGGLELKDGIVQDIAIACGKVCNLFSAG